MTAEDHNKTLVILHSAIGAFFTVGLIASPWIIAQNFRRPDKILFAIFVFGVVLLVAILFLVHGDCHVSKGADRQEVVLNRGGFGDSDYVAGGSLHMVVHA